VRFVVNEGPEGYPQFAKYIDSDECFMKFRRFGYLQTRIIFERQNELRILEDKLEAADNQTASPSSRIRSHNGTQKVRLAPKRLMDEIERKFRKYCERFIASRKREAYTIC
jgi:hypothetical protein